MEYLFLFLLVFTSGAAVTAEPDNQYQQQTEAGDRRARYYLVNTWVGSGDYEEAGYWVQKAATQGDNDALALLTQLRIHNPQRADYPQTRQLAEKTVKVGSKSGEVALARVLMNRRADPTNVAHTIMLLQDAARDNESDAAMDVQMLLGLIYVSGVYGPEDDVKASKYFKSSSAFSRAGRTEYWAEMMFQQGEEGFIGPNEWETLYWLNVSCPEGPDTGCGELNRISRG